MEIAKKISHITSLRSLNIRGNYMCYPVSGSRGNLGFFEALLTRLVLLESLTLGAGIWDPLAFSELWTPSLKEVYLGPSPYHGPNETKPIADPTEDTNQSHGTTTNGSCGGDESEEGDIEYQCSLLGGPANITNNRRDENNNNATALAPGESHEYDPHILSKRQDDTTTRRPSISYDTMFSRMKEHSRARDPFPWLQEWEKLPSRKPRRIQVDQPGAYTADLFGGIKNTLATGADDETPGSSGAQGTDGANAWWHADGEGIRDVLEDSKARRNRVKQRDMFMGSFPAPSPTPNHMENLVSVSFSLVDLASAPLFFYNSMPMLKRACVYVMVNDMGASGPSISLPAHNRGGGCGLEELSIVYKGLFTMYSSQIGRINELCRLFSGTLRSLSLSGLYYIDRFDFCGLFEACNLVQHLSLEGCHFDYMDHCIQSVLLNAKTTLPSSSIHSSSKHDKGAIKAHQVPCKIPGIKSLRLGVFSYTCFYLRSFTGFVERFPDLERITLADSFVVMISTLQRPMKANLEGEDGNVETMAFSKVHARPGMIDEEKDAFIYYCRKYFSRPHGPFKRLIDISFETQHGAQALFVV